MNLRKLAEDIKTENDVVDYRKKVADEIEKLKEKFNLLKVTFRENAKVDKMAKTPEDKMIRKTKNKGINKGIK